ncbi:MAG: thioredoxin domain-containing protein [Candidatus Yanofskybacteria bacterium]|nr:thioredoxin domain-containing protein [Candidatus Yanofskybacteria bacterium]
MNENEPMLAEGGMSRQERRELKRQQRQYAPLFQRRGVRRGLLWAGGFAVLVLIGWGMVKLSANEPLPTNGSGSVLSIPVGPQDNSKGPQDAPVTLVEYSDFQCPACGAFAPVVEQLLKDPELVGKVRFVYRNFPLSSIHKNADLAAQAGQAAAAQGKFWEMHDLLFENQTKWSGLSSSGARDAFIGFARTIGLNVDAFTKALADSAVAARVKADFDGGLQSGVNSTPTFFVNGTKMPHPQSLAQFKQYLTSALNATP